MTLNIEEIQKDISALDADWATALVLKALIDRVKELEGVISKSVEYLEASETPFYNGIKELKEAKSDG